MKVPVSASTPSSAISPTQTAGLIGYPSRYRLQIAPIAENGTASSTRPVFAADRVFQ